MNEEQTVLDFFSAEENLPLALIAAEHLDKLRTQHNNQFWLALKTEVDLLLSQNELPWHCELTEDRNADDTLVGVHLEPSAPQQTFLRPFMEQQLMGSDYRIYYGLMWNSSPDLTVKSLPAISSLHETLESEGFKQNDSFLAWQWSPWHPRRRDFLMRFNKTPDALLLESMQPWQLLLVRHGNLLSQANSALNQSAATAVISLAQLRSTIK